MLAANTIIDVQISTPRPVKLLRGHTLILNCTATTPLNTRVQMTWSYPDEVSDPFFYFFCRTVFLASEIPQGFWDGKNQKILIPVAVLVNKAALGLVRVLSLPGISWVWYAEIPSFDVWEFCFEEHRLVFLLHDSRWKERDCFIPGSYSVGFRDEREMYH